MIGSTMPAIAPIKAPNLFFTLVSLLNIDQIPLCLSLRGTSGPPENAWLSKRRAATTLLRAILCRDASDLSG